MESECLSMRNLNLTKFKKILVMLAIPLTVWLIMDIFAITTVGKHIFSSSLDLQNYIRSTGISVCIALALSYNLGNGRFDLSLGAQRMVATILGGNIAISLGLGSVGVILFALAFGLLFGMIVGLIFVITRIPPMVLGIGMALIYEGFAFAASNSQGLQLFGNAGLENLSNMYLTIGVVLSVTLFTLILDRYTKFGFHTRAIAGSQIIAHNSGIKIFRHAVACYTVAGGLVSFSGVFDAAFKGVMDAELGMISASYVLPNAFPMFLGRYLARWSSPAVGILVSTMMIRVFQIGLAVLKFSATTQQVFTLCAFLLFLVFSANENIFKEYRTKQARIALAKEKRKKLGLAL